MKVHFYQPTHSVLRKYIEGYYFISKDQTDQSIRYLTFPYNYFILSACQNVEIIENENKIEIYHSRTDNIIIDLVSRCSTSTEIYYDQPINEVTVYFKPLGMYHFYEKLSCTSLKDEIPCSALQEIMKVILNEPDRGLQIETLENYWLSKFNPKDLKQVEEIVKDLESELKIEEIAKKNKITRQYVNKISNRYLGKPASEYRKIFRFRNSIMKNKEMKNLTELSYENLFYDQSHFIRDFKELTTITPRAFFEKVNTEQNNIWLLI